MLHATIHGGQETLHFFGEVAPYNLQTLQQYVRSLRRDHDRLSLRVEVDAGDESDFHRYAGRWLRRLSGRGVRVDVEAVSAATAGFSPAMVHRPPAQT